jgi:hypothetical protein
MTLLEVQNLVMQLPTGDRWILLKNLLESLQPKTEEQQMFDLSAPSSNEIMVLAHNGNSFDFLNSEPNLYTIADGEPI